MADEIKTITILLHLLRYASDTIQIAEKWITKLTDNTNASNWEVLADLKLRRDNIETQRQFALIEYDKYITDRVKEAKGFQA